MNWRKSSRSFANGNCAEVGDFRKPSASMASGNCAEVGAGEAFVGVRDTKQEHLGEDRTVLVFPAKRWREFVKGLK